MSCFMPLTLSLVVLIMHFAMLENLAKAQCSKGIIGNNHINFCRYSFVYDNFKSYQQSIVGKCQIKTKRAKNKREKAKNIQ
jgi:hypothetical protein